MEPFRNPVSRLGVEDQREHYLKREHLLEIVARTEAELTRVGLSGELGLHSLYVND